MGRMMIENRMTIMCLRNHVFIKENLYCVKTRERERALENIIKFKRNLSSYRGVPMTNDKPILFGLLDVRNGPGRIATKLIICSTN